MPPEPGLPPEAAGPEGTPEGVMGAQGQEAAMRVEQVAGMAPQPEKPDCKKAIETLASELNEAVDALGGGYLPDVEVNLYASAACLSSVAPGEYTRLVVAPVPLAPALWALALIATPPENGSQLILVTEKWRNRTPPIHAGILNIFSGVMSASSIRRYGCSSASCPAASCITEL